MRIVATIAALLLSVAGASAQTYSAAPATGTPATDVASLQDALTKAASGGGTVNVPAGTYVTDRALLIGSDTRLVCAKGAVFKPVGRPGWKDPIQDIVINRNHPAASLTDHDIGIEGCTADMSNWPKNGVFGAFEMHAVARVKILYPTCTGGGAGCTRFLRTADTLIDHGTDTDANNACWDHWDSPRNAVVRNSSCVSQAHGILYTGTSTAGDSGGKATNGVFENNNVILTGDNFVGLWLQGGKDGSGATHSTVSHNRIEMRGNTGSCLKIDGASEADSISDNICVGGGAASQGIGVFPAGAHVPANITVAGNQFLGFNMPANGIAVLADCGTGSRITGNRIAGGRYPSAIRLCGTDQVVRGNQMDPGSSAAAPFYNRTGARNLSIVAP